MDCGYRLDIVVDEKIVLELKSVEEITGLHKAQLLTYLRISRKKVGLLMNFNVPVLKDGIVRLVCLIPQSNMSSMYFLSVFSVSPWCFFFSPLET